MSILGRSPVPRALRICTPCVVHTPRPRTPGPRTPYHGTPAPRFPRSLGFLLPVKLLLFKKTDTFLYRSTLYLLDA